MGEFVAPKVFLTGYSSMDLQGVEDYLMYTDQKEFLELLQEAKGQGVSDGECMCSFYAKLCYKSLVEGLNSNITKIREIPDNIIGTFNQGHGSVFEHATINFVATNVSRVFTHELVRMRAGWAYSQTSGRYVRLDKIDFVHDPILDDCTDLIKEALSHDEKIIYLIECRKGLRKPNSNFPHVPAHATLWSMTDLAKLRSDMGFEHEIPLAGMSDAVKWIPDISKEMSYKKKVTSAARRIAPNGQSNEIGFTINFRAIRHFLMLRSNRGAEWEIRNVTEQIYHLIKDRFPLLLHGIQATMIDGAMEFTGMRTQPYELCADDPKAIRVFSTKVLKDELERRNSTSRLENELEERRPT